MVICDCENIVKSFDWLDLTVFEEGSLLTSDYCAIVGVWFMHCHLEVHTTWGLKMAFVVDNGKGPNESILPPPSDLPKCWSTENIFITILVEKASPEKRGWKR